MANTAMNFYIVLSDNNMRRVYDEDTHEFLGWDFYKKSHRISYDDLINLMSLENELNYWISHISEVPYTRIQLWGLCYFFLTSHVSFCECTEELNDLRAKNIELLKKMTNLVTDFRNEPRCNFKY